MTDRCTNIFQGIKFSCFKTELDFCEQELKSGSLGGLNDPQPCWYSHFQPYLKIKLLRVT